MIKVVEQFDFQDDEIRAKLLSLSQKYQVFSILDSQKWPHDLYQSYDLIGAFGAHSEITTQNHTPSFEDLRKFHRLKKDWAFGYLSYDLKNNIENLKSENYDGIQAPSLHFFCPKVLFTLKKKYFEVWIQEDFLDDVELKQQIESILKEQKPQVNRDVRLGVDITHRIGREEYLHAIKKIQKHIKVGDIYELNFCQEFYAENTVINPINVFHSLVQKSPTPFSSYFRMDHVYVMSASPERYIKKQGAKVISQPIKGTARRHKNAMEDEKIKNNLKNDQKERAENIMIVDLVRNDLSHTAKESSVKVKELCEIYSFEQVHQMISTVQSEIASDYDFIDVLKTTFPMGSMTGAPKIRAMELIELYEKTKRGIYSGAIGYITPEGDFDFNVVIRTLIYNETRKYLSFIAGGAITYQSDPEKEYEECLLKAEAIFDILS